MKKDIIVKSVNISLEKGTIKKTTDTAEITEQGIKGDAHAGAWHRQISMLGTESIEKFSAMAKRGISYGEFAENITTEGMLLYHALPLDTFENKDIVLQVTQIGKECHGSKCAIFNEVGNCVMPKEGIFCRVLQGGKLKAGDKLTYKPRPFTFHVITLSDRASKGIYDDRSGPRIIKHVKSFYADTNRPVYITHTIIPDKEEDLALHIQKSVAVDTDFIITTGGTGIGPRDITTDVVKPLLEKEIPGIMEMVRVKYGMQKPNAFLSRSVAGTIQKTCLFTLPGSLKAVDEYMNELPQFFNHLIYTLYELDFH